MQSIHSTTVVLVRRGDRVCMASDGQVTLGQATVIKAGAKKVRRLGKEGKVLVGFAGGGADGLALFSRLEEKLEKYSDNLERAVVELAKDWRTDRSLRRLEAVMLVADRRHTFFLTGSGELLQPDESEEGLDGAVLAIGSGSNFALAAARALLRHTDLSAEQVARESLGIAAHICVYTNQNLTLEEL